MRPDGVHILIILAIIVAVVMLFRLLKNLGRRAANAATTPRRQTPPGGVADELQKLDQLRRNGVITDAEFEHQKNSLLRRQ